MVLKASYASTPELLDRISEVRHEVFAEEEGLLSAAQDRKLGDRYDAYPATKNLAVTSRNRVVGSFRLVVDSSLGLPADQYFNFRERLPEGCRLMHAGMFCLLPSYRGAGLPAGLGLMAADLAVSERVTHVVSPINPRIGSLLMRAGYRAIGEEFIEPHTGASMIPLVYDVQAHDGRFNAFVEQHQLGDFLCNYERWYCKAGEPIVQVDPAEERAFLVVDGAVRVVRPGNGDAVAELGPGEFVGGSGARGYDLGVNDVVAASTAQIMVWPSARTASRIGDLMARSPAIAHAFAQRSRTMVDRLQRPST